MEKLLISKVCGAKSEVGRGRGKMGNTYNRYVGQGLFPLKNREVKSCQGGVVGGGEQNGKFLMGGGKLKKS